MAELAIPFYTQAAVLDQFIHAEHPAEDAVAVEVVLEILGRNADLRAYFFRSRPNSAWISVLWEHGFFSSPPAPISSPEGERLPFWDAQEYLLSVATEVPEYVLRHVNTIQGHPIYIARAVRSLTLLPTKIINKALPRLCTWLKEYSIGVHITEEVLTLIKSLALENIEAALTLFEAISLPFSNSKANQVENYIYSSEAISLLEQYNFYEEEFKKLVGDLMLLDAQKLIVIFEAHLLRGLRIEAETRGSDTGLSSWWWRSAIESSDQNYHHHYKDDLLDFLRDTCEYQINSNVKAGLPLIKEYLRDANLILRRLGVHLLRVNVASYITDIREILLNRDNYDDIQIHHEFMLLLQAGYPLLNEEDRYKVIGILLAGPSKDRVAQLAKFSNAEGGPDKEEYIRACLQHWTLARLWMIKDYLESKDADTLRDLLAERGAPDHPAFLSWSSGVHSIQDVSPLPAEQMGNYSPRQLVAFLQQWKPTEEHTIGTAQVSREGLATNVADIVVPNVTAYKEELGILLALHPEYSYAILLQADTRAQNKEMLAGEWIIYVEACESLLEVDNILTDMERNFRVGWREVRQWVVALLQQAVSSDAEEVTALLPRIRNLFLKMLNDPDPTLEMDRPEKGWHGHNDPHTLAINHVRPSALIGLAEYARKYANQREDKDTGVGPERLEVVVRDAFTKMLQDSSRAVHSVFGRYLMLLYWLDQAWLLAHLDMIFLDGQEEEEIWMYVAAWDAYTIFNSNLYPTLIVKLRPQYELAIDNLSRGYVSNTHLEPVRGLITHLLLDYFANGQQHSDLRFDKLLYRFFDQASEEERSRAAWMIWRKFKDREETSKNVEALWPVACTLWQDRIDRAASLNFPSDFSKEMAWFAQLLEFVPPHETLVTLWPLLTGTLHYAADAGARPRIWEAFEKYLARQVKTDPVRSIEFFAQLCENTERPLWAFDDAPMRSILETAVAYPASRSKTLALLDRLARKGDMRFRDLYERFAA